jgi:hypothetical protein
MYLWKKNVEEINIVKYTLGSNIVHSGHLF